LREKMLERLGWRFGKDHMRFIDIEVEMGINM
jgi:hypothetical protein